MKTKLVRNNDFVFRDEGGEEGVLFDSNSGSVFLLNETAAGIWNLVDGKRDLETIKKEILKTYSGADNDELLSAVDFLRNSGALCLPEAINMFPLMPTPRSVDIEITNRCNNNCSYCYYLNNQDVIYEDLPAASWLKFINELGSAHVLKVTLSGGEALLRDDIIEIINAVAQNRMRFTLLTNGKKITREIARQIKRTDHCEMIQVSLDGSNALVHESLRGKGTFEPAVNAIKILKEEGLPLTVRVTIHPGNVENLPELTQLLLEDFKIVFFGTNSISSLGTHSKYNKGLFLNAAQRLRAMLILAELDKKYPDRIQASAGPLAEWKMFHEMETARLAGKHLPNRGRLLGCGCIFSRIAVRSDGAYIPCVMLPQMVLGYINKDPLGEVWQHSAKLNKLKRRIELFLNSFEECAGCEYASLCTGNCAGTASSLTNDANRPSTEGCLRRFKEELSKVGLSLFDKALV